MTTTLVSMGEIARLANVSRQAVTNWRSRSAQVPFPTVQEVQNGVERFDREEVVDWLEATGRGLNPEARADAPALTTPDAVTLDEAVIALALRANASEDLGPMTPAERSVLAEEIDPLDTHLLTEARQIAGNSDLVRWADEFFSASFGPADALRRLYSSAMAQGQRGAAAPLVDLVQELASACRTHLGPDNVAVQLDLDPRERGIASGFGTAALTETHDRSMLRHLALEGLEIFPPTGALVRVISTLGMSDADALQVADDAVLSLESNQACIVVGPASALCDKLTGDSYAARSSTLRVGTLRAAFRLPRGLWRQAHRQQSGVWIFYAAGETARVAVGDLSHVAGTPAGLVDDVLGALAQTGSRAYQHSRLLPYADVWTRDIVVPHGVGAVEVAPTGSIYDTVTVATLVTREPIPGFDISVSPGAPLTRSAQRSLGELADTGEVKVLSGSRFDVTHFDEAGSIPVITADGAIAGHLDALIALDTYSHTVRTEPGDIVFSTAPPRAVVDIEGGSRVASPSRIIRINADKHPSTPHTLAAAINHLATSSEWRTWPVPDVTPSQAQMLERILAEATNHLAALRRHEAALTQALTHLVTGVASGSLALTPTADRKDG